MSDTTKEKAREAAEAIRETGESALKDARSSAASTTTRLKDAAGEAVDNARKGAADQGDRAASALHDRADSLDEDGVQRRLLKSLAGGMESLSTRVREGSISQVISDAENFARRNPMLFIAGAALAGFAIARMTQSRRDNGEDA